MLATAIVLAHGAEPDLPECVAALVVSGVPEILVVDNEAAAGQVAAVESLPGVRVLRPGHNLGYAGGCNLAGREAAGDTLVFVNSDALVQPGAVAALVERVQEPSVGLACASIRLAQEPELLNSAGNPVHYLMYSWVGSFREPAQAHDSLTEVASISGVAYAVRREVWAELGGFDETYFAYCEDVYLSLRAWQAGYRVVHDPSAVVLHRYQFARNAAKNYLLERNRLMNLLLLPERRTRRLVIPAAMAVELGVLLVAARDGWARDKVAGWRWLLTHRKEIAARRVGVQAARRVPDQRIVGRLRGPLDPPTGLGPEVPALVSRALDRYWHLVVRWV